MSRSWQCQKCNYSRSLREMTRPSICPSCGSDELLDVDSSACLEQSATVAEQVLGSLKKIEAMIAKQMDLPEVEPQGDYMIRPLGDADVLHRTRCFIVDANRILRDISKLYDDFEILRQQYPDVDVMKIETYCVACNAVFYPGSIDQVSSTCCRCGSKEIEIRETKIGRQEPAPVCREVGAVPRSGGSGRDTFAGGAPYPPRPERRPDAYGPDQVQIPAGER